MRVSSRTEYALRTVVDLAARVQEGLCRSADIARRQNIPAKFLEQILLVLKGAGIVESRRGARGGYCLALPASRITVASIVRLTEEGLSPVPTRGAGLGREESAFADIWADLHADIERKLESVTIQELSERQAARSPAAGSGYVI